MKEVKIHLDEDMVELLDIIAKRKNTDINKIIFDIIKGEAVRIGYKMVFKELEEAYEREKERRDVKNESS